MCVPGSSAHRCYPAAAAEVGVRGSRSGDGGEEGEWWSQHCCGHGSSSCTEAKEKIMQVHASRQAKSTDDLPQSLAPAA